MSEVDRMRPVVEAAVAVRRHEHALKDWDFTPPPDYVGVPAPCGCFYEPCTELFNLQVALEEATEKYMEREG